MWECLIETRNDQVEFLKGLVTSWLYCQRGRYLNPKDRTNLKLQPHLDPMG